MACKKSFKPGPATVEPYDYYYYYYRLDFHTEKVQVRYGTMGRSGVGEKINKKNTLACLSCLKAYLTLR